MALKSNFRIVIMFSDWLKNLTPVFQPMRNKTKTSALSKLQVTVGFIALCAPVMLGLSNHLRIGFSKII